MLKLTKKGDKYWLFEDSEIGLFSPSKFTINLLNNDITIVYENGLKSKTYNVIDCEIYDLGSLIPFTTSIGNDFMAKLEELNCPCFQKNENIYYISSGLWSELTDFDLLPDATTPLAGTEEIPIVQSGVTKKVAVSEFDGIYESLSNKSTSTSLGTSDTLYPTQNAVKTYADTKVDKVTSSGVERAYIINADGSQATKPTSDFGGVLEFADFIKPIKYGKIELPTEFNNDIPFELYRDSDSLIKHTLNVNSRYKGGTKIYVASTGNDTTGDGTELLPYKTLTKAITVAVAGGDLKYEILVNNEFLNRDENIFNQTISNKTIAVISTNENKTITSSNSTYAWTLDGTGTYKATRAGVLSTIDFLNKDIYGLPVPLKQVSTLLLCQAEAGTWYTDGSIVWVHRIDGIIPTNLNTGVNIGVIGIDPQLGTNGVLYFENFIFCGWQNGVSLRVRNSVSSGSGELCVNNCFFVGKKGLTSNGNCLSVVGLKNAYVLNCISAYGQRDGFNYTYDTLSTRLDRELCTYFEYNCLAYDLGLVEAGSLSNNVSSAHNGVKGIRVGTIGYNNTGATIHDVTGCISLLYDCRLRHPVTGGVYGSGASYFFSSEGDGVSKGIAFLNNCSATNNTNALIVGATQVVNIDKFVYTGSVINGGTINYID